MTQEKNLWFHSGAAVRLRARLLVNFESQEFLRWQLFDIRRQVDTSLMLSPLRGPGLPRDTDAHVHTGFLYAFRSVGGRVLDVLREQFEKCPLYDVAVSGKPSCCFFNIRELIVSAGHSLGVRRPVLLRGYDLCYRPRTGCYCVHCSIIYQEHFP